MVDYDDLQLALAHYALLFPDRASLGEGTPPTTWKAEYDRVSAEGLSSTLINAASFEGGQASALKNFDQKTLLRALLQRRSDLDSSFIPFKRTPRNLGITLRIGP